MTAVADRLAAANPDLSVTHSVIADGPAGVLVRESATAGLVLVGRRGRDGFPDLLAGSVSTQVATYAHAPVIVVPAPSGGITAPPGPGPVVVGVDGSPAAGLALGFAFEEAQARHTPLVAIHLHNETRPSRRPGQAPAQDVLAEALSGWSAKYPDVTVQPRTCHDRHPAAALLDAAAGAALLVVGHRGHGGFGRLRLGSVSHALLAHADVPLAIIHPR
jgi:nucleotide-binding universal stress UspA family protein